MIKESDLALGKTHKSIFPEKRLLDVSLRPPPPPPTEKRHYLKSQKSIFFELGRRKGLSRDIVSIFDIRHARPGPLGWV